MLLCPSHLPPQCGVTPSVCYLIQSFGLDTLLIYPLLFNPRYERQERSEISAYELEDLSLGRLEPRIRVHWLMLHESIQRPYQERCFNLLTRLQRYWAHRAVYHL